MLVSGWASGWYVVWSGFPNHPDAPPPPMLLATIMWSGPTRSALPPHCYWPRSCGRRNPLLRNPIPPCYWTRIIRNERSDGLMQSSHVIGHESCGRGFPTSLMRLPPMLTTIMWSDAPRPLVAPDLAKRPLVAPGQGPGTYHAAGCELSRDTAEARLHFFKTISSFN